MPYLLDSDIVIEYLRDDLATMRLIRSLTPQGVAISMVTYMEVYQGILRDADPAAVTDFETFLRTVPIVPFSEETARRCAALREELRRRGRRVRSRALDLLTAATALEHDFILVTRNTADYDDIPNLALWDHPP